LAIVNLVSDLYDIIGIISLIHIVGYVADTQIVLGIIVLLETQLMSRYAVSVPDVFYLEVADSATEAPEGSACCLVIKHFLNRHKLEMIANLDGSLDFDLAYLFFFGMHVYLAETTSSTTWVALNKFGLD
jgi:hypothetical protein